MIGAPLIVTAGFSTADFQWLDGLRGQYYPPDRNRVPAHLTLFHHLPPSALQSLQSRLRDETRDVPAPQARLAAVRCIGRGVALDVDSPGLADIRARLADALELVLMPQDRAAWRPHVTIQNKVEPAAAKALAGELDRAFKPRPLAISALMLWRYVNGPWEAVARYPFR